jgi:hypothetical protein
MTWTCEQTEARLSEYLEGALGDGERVALDTHLMSGCERCTNLVTGVSQLLSSMRGMEQVEPPPRLIYGILDKTLGPRETASGWHALLAWLRGIGSVRLAYGALSMAATLVILVTAAGFNWRRPRLADLQPAILYRHLNSSVHLGYAKGTKFVNDLRVVNEIQSRLREDNELPTSQEGTAPRPTPDKQPGQTDRSRPSSPKQQNRANDVVRPFEVLAEEMPWFAAPWTNCQATGTRRPS